MLKKILESNLYCMLKIGFPCIGLFVRGESKGNRGPRGSEGDLDPTFRSLKIGVYFEKQKYIFFLHFLLSIFANN
jgi:hypothetical protein